MRELMIRYLTEQTLESFLSFRQALLDHPAYSPYSQDLNQLDALFREERFAEVLEAFPAALPNLLLSPRAHMLVSMAHGHTGNEKSKEAEKALYFALLDGILMTGDGSAERPYLVCRTSDEYDLLVALQKRPQKQSLIHHGGRSLDRHQLEGGEELYFDVTPLQQKLGQDLLAADREPEDTKTKRPWWKLW